MNAICGIYKITSPSRKVYIGQSKNIYKRWLQYRSLNCKSQILLYNSLKKYGVDKHVFEIVCECSPLDLISLEQDYIYLFDCENSKHGLNSTFNVKAELIRKEIKHKKELIKNKKRNYDIAFSQSRKQTGQFFIEKEITSIKQINKIVDLFAAIDALCEIYLINVNYSDFYKNGNLFFMMKNISNVPICHLHNNIIQNVYTPI